MVLSDLNEYINETIQGSVGHTLLPMKMMIIYIFLRHPFRGHIDLLMPVCLSVDHMVSDGYLENFLSQSLHISFVDWSCSVSDSY